MIGDKDANIILWKRRLDLRHKARRAIFVQRIPENSFLFKRRIGRLEYFFENQIPSGHQCLAGKIGFYFFINPGR